MINFRDELTYARFGKKKSCNPPIKGCQRLEMKKSYFSLSTVRKMFLGSVHHAL